MSARKPVDPFEAYRREVAADTASYWRELADGMTDLLLTNPAARRKALVTALRREIAKRAAELERAGVRNPVTRAEKEVAERLGYVSGVALNRWLCRNR